MDQTQIQKNNALALLKSGKSVDEVAKEVEVSIVLVQEWRDSLPNQELVDMKHRALVNEDAVKLLKQQMPIDLITLQAQLLKLALSVLENAKQGMSDPEIAFAANKTADTVAKINNSFFGSTNNMLTVNSELPYNEEKPEVFKALTKD